MRISQHSAEKFDRIMFDDVTNLLAQCLELMEMLKAAWAKGSFREI
jgi:hypothetical protein